jgi:hypothetical protein
MPNLAHIVERMLNALPLMEGADPNLLFARGRVKERDANCIATALQQWLETNQKLFGENIRVTVLDSMTDEGVDVLLEGVVSEERVGFQIKSERDVADTEFAPRTQMQRDRAFEAYHLTRLMLILACPSSSKYQPKYARFQTAAARSPTRPVLVVEPERAARLWLARTRLLPPELVLAGRSWSDFFTEVRQAHLRALYLERWPGLPPHQRFMPPQGFEQLRRAVTAEPLTVLTGPPAVGKTFTAMQLLYEHYRAGRAVQWLTAVNLEPTEGPIARPEGAPDLQWRVEQLVRGLGRRPGQPPLNPTEFLGRQLEPGSLIYLEDPFGKTDEEFNRSLSTYAFFDLHRFVNAVLTEPGWQDCRFLITSRDGLFERWLADLRRRAEPVPHCAVITVTQGSYSHPQRAWYIQRLAVARNLAVDEPAATRLARTIETLYEADLILRQLSPGASLGEIQAVADRERGTLVQLTDRLLQPRSNAERLYLFLAAGLQWANSTIIDFAGWYAALHRALSLPGAPGAALEAIPPRITDQFTREITEQKKGWYTLHPNHSTVLDSIGRGLRASNTEWISHLSHALQQVTRPDQTPGVKATLAHYLIVHAPNPDPEAQTALRQALFRQSDIDPTDIMSLVGQWEKLDPAIQSDLTVLLSGGYGPVSIDWAALVTLMGNPVEAKWAVLQELVGSPAFLQDPGPFKPNPWTYFFEHIDEAPPALLEALSDLAGSEPDTFAMGMAIPAVPYWERVPLLWKHTILWDCEDAWEVQDRLLDSIAEQWESVPAELRRYLQQQSRHEDGHVRAAAYTAALRHHEQAPRALGQIWKRALSEPDVRIPLSTFLFTACIKDHHRRFAEALLERADKTVAAAMLQGLTRKGWPIKEWGWELARACHDKGGEYSEAYCTHESFGDTNFSERMGFTPAPIPEGQSDPVRFAWVWAYIQSGGNCPKLLDERFLDLLCDLPDSSRSTAVAQMIEFEDILPRRIKRKLQQAEPLLGLGPEFIRRVRQFRDPDSVKLMEFPLWLFFPEGAYPHIMRFERLFRRPKGSGGN